MFRLETCVRLAGKPKARLGRMKTMNFKRAFCKSLAAAALATAALVAMPASQAGAQVVITAGYAPPAIPVYEQPLCPGDGYLWTPGYWAWGDGGYYWVDGAWVLPPYVEALWTPGWWGWGGGGYFWHTGYWGRSIGYYGGINYGFGYFGVGFYGGYWGGGHFFYNRAYGNFGDVFHAAVYNRAYSGFSGHPGGASFNAHPPAQFASNHGEALNHSSSINGRGGESFAGNTSHSSFGGSSNGAGNYSHSSAPSYSHAATPSYSGGQGYSHSSAPSSSYHGGGSSAPSSHASSGGGGGGSHGSSSSSHR
jgi:hypothetical protein